MAETSIASAVVVSDIADEQPASPNPLKRRQSDVHREEQGQGVKRPRTGKSSPPAKDGVEEMEESSAAEESTAAKQPSSTRPARRQNSIADEKQRSKRLFGALLGNLNQPGDRTTKRRQEIESRRKAELQRQDDERVEDSLRKEEKRAELKRREQVGFDRRIMRTRHANMLHTANFLQTTTEPRLYYRPWDLRPDEEDRIEQQTIEVQAQIDKELDDFDQRHARYAQEQRQQNGGQDVPPSQAQEPERTESEERNRALAKSDGSKPAAVPDFPPPSEAANHDTNDMHGESKDAPDPDGKQGRGEEVEEEADHVVDADEDTVIY